MLNHLKINDKHLSVLLNPHIFLYLMYLILAGEAIYFLAINNVFFFCCSIIIIGVGLVLNILRRIDYIRVIDALLGVFLALYERYNRYFHKKETARSVDWQVVRKTLHELLLRNKIIAENIQSEKSGEKLASELPEDIMRSFLKENPEIVENLRQIGLDGLLCLIFLLEQLPALTSARTIHRVLKIPQATVYRQLQKLKENELIETHYVVSKPKKAYYRITEKGTSIVVDLYEFLEEIIITPVSSVERQREKAASVN